ncbi:zinc-ribbon domain-containing protein [Pelagibacterales bacterium SAG-MED20]|nr:zinc-ribbon domain-containing protein [Pelagibacterales bacterium SAG-MED20]
MIITCVNCNKKFEIDSNLIPESGRLVQCSACNNQWFFKKEIQVSEQDNPVNDVNLPIDKNIDGKPNIEVPIDESFNKDQVEKKKNLTVDMNIIRKKSETKSFRILNFILVFIITIIALIIVIDTFQSPISILIPNIELILFNLYETFTDIFLFLKDLT